jgi:hypothetical protein
MKKTTHVHRSPRRARGTICRSLSAWQATAQIVPLVLPHVSLTFGRSCFADEPVGFSLPTTPATAPRYTHPATRQMSAAPRPVVSTPEIRTCHGSCGTVEHESRQLRPLKRSQMF